MEKIKTLENLRMFKFLSIIGYVECILIPIYLGYIYLIENPNNLRPDRTILMLAIISLFGFPTNVPLTLGLFLESKFNKNFRDIKRHLITNIGFYLFLGITLIGILTFLFLIFLILIH